MSRRRLELRHYARMYLGVKRLPTGVPERLDTLLAHSMLPVPRGAIGHVLDRYRKRLMLPCPAL